MTPRGHPLSILCHWWFARLSRTFLVDHRYSCEPLLTTYHNRHRHYLRISFAHWFWLASRTPSLWSASVIVTYAYCRLCCVQMVGDPVVVADLRPLFRFLRHLLLRLLRRLLLRLLRCLLLLLLHCLLLRLLRYSLHPLLFSQAKNVYFQYLLYKILIVIVD